MPTPGYTARVLSRIASMPAWPRPRRRTGPRRQGAVVVAPGPNSDGARGCTGLRWLHCVPGWLAARPRHWGPGRVRSYAPVWGRAAGSGCRGRGSGQCRVSAAPGTHRAAGPGPVVPRALPVRRAVTAVIAQGAPGVAASCGPVGTGLGGGERSPGGQGIRVRGQHPNTALEATGHSARLVAGGGLYRVARASAWAFGSTCGKRTAACTSGRREALIDAPSALMGNVFGAYA